MAGMRGRAKANWVGVCLEAPDPQALADFYSAVLGWPVAQRDAHGAAIQLEPVGHPFCLYLDT